MRTTGHIPCALTLAVLSCSPVLGGVIESPPETPTPIATTQRGEIHLSEYARHTALDRSALGTDSGPLIITTETVRKFGAQGLLTVGLPHSRSPLTASRPGSPPGTPNPERLREEWRAKVLRQKDQVARVDGDIVLLDAKIESLETTAVHGRDGAARRQARIAEARGRRSVLARQLARERARLGTLIRSAREQGAEPGWFR